MSDFLAAGLILLSIIGGIFMTVFLVMILWTAGPSTWACEDYQKVTKLPTTMLFWSGCFVTMPDGAVLPKHQAQEIIGRNYQHKYQIEVK